MNRAEMILVARTMSLNGLERFVEELRAMVANNTGPEERNIILEIVVPVLT
jgi:hypothetical protein